MPEGYNPSDDSDEEYVEMAASKRRSKDSIVRSQRKRKHEKDEDKTDVAAKKTREEKTADSIQSVDICPLCGVKDLVWPEEFNRIKVHIIMDYLKTNRFSELKILVPKDSDAEGKPQDVTGKKVKYTCKYQGCNKKNIGYTEMAHHYATKHQELKILLRADPNKKMNIISKMLYGDQEHGKSDAVKKEKVEAIDPIEKEDVPYVPPPPPKVVTPAPAPASALTRRGRPRAQQPRLAVKKEEFEVESNYPQEDENEDEDVDDPAAPTTPPPNVPIEAPVQSRRGRPRAQQTQALVPKPEVKVSPVSSNTPVPVRVAKKKNCPLCNEGRNLSSSDLRSHMSLCVYGKSGYIPFLPHKQGDQVKCEDLCENKRVFKYFCPYGPDVGDNGEACFKFGDKKPMGYKEFSIHMGRDHGVLERWAEVNNQEVYEMLREEKSEELPEMLEYRVEEGHICLLCNGEAMDKQTNLGFDDPDKIRTTRFHYANCLFVQSPELYYEQYPHGQPPQEGGGPEDIMGSRNGFKYSCKEKGCTNKRQMGYKEFVIHQAKDHNGLLKLIVDHENPAVIATVKRLF